MKTELKQTKDYLLFIEVGAEIKEDDYYHWKLTNTVQINRLFEEDRRLGRKGPRGHVSKVIAYRKLNEEAKDLNLPLLPNPFNKQIDEVTHLKNLGNECFIKMKELNPSGGIKEFIRMAVEFGYKAAQSKQFSLEDVINYSNWLSQWLFYNKYKKVIDGAKPYGIGELISNKDLIKMFVAGLPSSNPPLSQETIQSLSTQQLPKDFIPEYEYANREGIWKSVLLPSEWFGSDEGDNPKRFKTITNSEGKQELVGTWKFAK